MKKILILFCLFASLHSFAQKIDLDREQFPVQYIELPESNALIGLNTYNVLFYSAPATLAELGLKDADLENAFNMIGYTYTKDPKADFVLEVSIDHMRIISESIETRKTDVKDAAGVVTTQTSYYILSNVTAPTYIKIINKQTIKELEYFGFANTNSPITFKSGEFPTLAAAQAYAGKSLVTDRSNFFVKTYQEKFKTNFDYVHSKYCFEFKTGNALFWKVDLKKAPEYAEFNDQLMKAKEVFAKMRPTESVEPLKAELAPIMQYWSDNAAKVSTEEKAGRKLKFAYLTALARAQFWMEMFPQCEITLKEIIANNYDELDAKMVVNAIEKLKKSMVLNNTTTRHFDRPGFSAVERFRVAGNIQALENTQIAVVVKTETAPQGYTILPGYLIDFEQNRVDGELWVKNMDSELAFMPENQTVFVYQTPSGQKKMTISADNIDKIVLGRSAKFEALPFKNSMGFPEKVQLFRVLYENDKIRVLKLYKTANTGTTSIKQTWAGTELCLMKKSNGIIQPMVGITAAKTTDNTSAFYNDCQVLQQKIVTGEIKELNQVANQKIAADYYVESCK